MKLLGLLFLACFIIQCAQFPLDTNPPFTITKATYNTKDGILNIHYTSENSITFKNVFFQQQKEKATLIEATKIMAHFKKAPHHNDLQLHGDAKKEFGNTPHAKNIDFPFELEKNEVIISYHSKNSLKYFKTMLSN